MNKSALKSFATEARLELLEKTQLQARKLGITPDAIQHASLESSDAIFIDGKPLSDVERKQRNKLITRVNEIGYDRVMEEAAYTWFNRFIALRYMEVNDYLPTKVRVLSSVNLDSTEPDMFKEALNLDLPIDKEFVYNLKIENKTDELFEYLIKVHCNDLNRYMPFMFENVEGYLEILFPKGLLGTDTFVRKMTDVNVIAEEDWTKVEIVGWLYQYYISEENERVIKAKKKYKKEEIPYATQLFTPEWIVRYMVQNALGRYWIESHPEQRDLIGNWEYYLENPNPEPDFDEKIAPYVNKELNVEDIKCFDPAMGSGHILAYMFDVLYEIYSKCGYIDREIPRLIIEKNLYGLDVDNRAYQLASFTVVMKAVQYDKRFLRSIKRESLKLNIFTFIESTIDDDIINYICQGNDFSLIQIVETLIAESVNSKIIGSLKISSLSKDDLKLLKKRIQELLNNNTQNLFEVEYQRILKEFFLPLINQNELIVDKFDIVVTNPPYLSSSKMETTLNSYINKYYPKSKSDLFAAFIERSFTYTKSNGQIGFLTPFVWMYLSSYKELRDIIVNQKAITSLIELEYNAFPEAMVPVCTFTMKNYLSNSKGEYIRLVDFPGPDIQKIKVLEAITQDCNYRYSINSRAFSLIEETPISYWLTNNALEILKNSEALGIEFAAVKKGMNTSDNERFLRFWFEVEEGKFGKGIKNKLQAKESMKKWFPYNKGGGFKKWYGYNEWVINYENDGVELQNFKASDIRNPQYYFSDCLTWSAIGTTKPFSIRFSDYGAVFDSAGSSVFLGENNKFIYYIQGLLQSRVANYFLKAINPTINYGAGTVSKIPLIINEQHLEEINSLVKENINISKRNWAYLEKALEYKKHFILDYEGNLLERFNKWFEEENHSREKVLSNEIKINEIFIEIYNLQAEIDLAGLESEMTLEVFDQERFIKSLLSYAIGWILGRYSGRSKDYILLFDKNDLINKINYFLENQFGKENFTFNKKFICSVLRKKDEADDETLINYFINDYYNDHISEYSSRGRKAPIYWLFTSGKEKAFNCLIYIHGYDKTTLSRIRTDYVHEVQSRMDAEKNDLLNIINGDSTVKEIAAAKKKLKSLEKKIDELKKYDELLHHMADQQIEFDLDDGVKHNYELFKGLVAPIK
ncbi:BREX-1 system adenine-specific DNA-methyltransferase PglX [Lysinibacillus sp. C5.1]|uniref:BREX-1 system adenine-specific DNA-methyltransferase PglX n=2 Tax=Lysinibacillus TaxID=400634 RepID=UPI0030813271